MNTNPAKLTGQAIHLTALALSPHPIPDAYETAAWRLSKAATAGEMGQMWANFCEEWGAVLTDIEPLAKIVTTAAAFLSFQEAQTERLRAAMLMGMAPQQEAAFREHVTRLAGACAVPLGGEFVAYMGALAAEMVLAKEVHDLTADLPQLSAEGEPC